MGPDSNKMIKPGFKNLYKYADLVVLFYTSFITVQYQLFVGFVEILNI